jgi:hypothetical protein
MKCNIRYLNILKCFFFSLKSMYQKHGRVYKRDGTLQAMLHRCGYDIGIHYGYSYEIRHFKKNQNGVQKIFFSVFIILKQSNENGHGSVRTYHTSTMHVPSTGTYVLLILQHFKSLNIYALKFTSFPFIHRTEPRKLLFCTTYTSKENNQ